MRVSEIAIDSSDAGCELRGWVESEADPDHPDWFAAFPLWFRFPSWCRPYLSEDNGDPFLAALLFAAMRTGEPLTIAAPISPRLLATAPTIQDVYAAFDPRARRVPVTVRARGQPLVEDGGKRGVGLFFSLGIDSYYSLLKNERTHPADNERVTHLISIHGFDVAHGEWDPEFSRPFWKT